MNDNPMRDALANAIGVDNADKALATLVKIGCAIKPTTLPVAVAHRAQVKAANWLRDRKKD